MVFKNGDLHIVCKRLQCRHFVIELHLHICYANGLGYLKHELVLTGTPKHDKICHGVFLEQSMPIDRRKLPQSTTQFINGTAEL